MEVYSSNWYLLVWSSQFPPLYYTTIYGIIYLSAVIHKMTDLEWMNLLHTFGNTSRIIAMCE